MKVVVTDYVKGAQSAEGVVVIIDVFRAFSVACYCISSGVKSVTAVGSVEAALALSNVTENSLLIGEREGKKLPGFDVGNSPTDLSQLCVSGKNVIHTTHAGTQGLTNAINADVIVTGAFVNAQATVDYIKSLNPKVVTLVRMGWKAETNTDEDDLCAEYFKALLLNEPFDKQRIEPELRNSPCAQRFLDPKLPWNPESDLGYCLALDKFDFALEAQQGNRGNVRLTVVKAS